MVNFLVNYGGGYGTLSNNAEIPLDEAKDILSKYEKAFCECMAWKRRQIDKVFQENRGIVYTLFGRPRRLGSFIYVANRNMNEDDSIEMMRKCDGYIRSAERRVASHEIQGLAGDICRLVLIKLYDKYFKEPNEEIAFINTVHDEINFYIDRDKVLKYARDLEDLMRFSVPEWPFDITTSTDLGNRWGSTIPFTWLDPKTRQEFVPKRCK
jgi:DNA polymerase I-like protein with 3'-5' exonuclease and polymerase domains